MVGSAAVPTVWDYELAACEPAAASATVPAGPGGESPELEALAPRGGPSLDQVIGRVWAEITGHQLVSCPWCGGEMRPRDGAPARPVGARCSDCGAVLS